MMQRASCGLGTSLTVTSVATASMPSEPMTSASRSRPGASSASLPNSIALAVDGEAAHAQHVVHGQAVLQAVHAAGVLGDVAADGAGDLGRRIGRVVQAVGRRRLGDRPDCARRAARRAVRPPGRSSRMRLNLASDSSTPSACGSAPPDRPVPAPRATTGTFSAAGSQHAPHLRLGLRQRHGHRQLRGRPSARRIRRARVLLVPQQRMRRQDGAERRSQGAPGGCAIGATGGVR